MNKIIKAASVSLVVLSSSFFAQAAEAAQKVGYINTAQVFQALPQREVVLQKLQEEFKDKAAELQTIQVEAQTKIEKLKRDGELLGQDEVEKLRIEIGQLDSKYKIKAQALEKASARREAEEKQKLFMVIQEAVQKVAEKEGYDIVVDVQAMQYGKADYNLSEKVIKQLK
ncbi:OmpH family outer membrane protein [Vibrio aestuarianus]|uniref:Chaperone protein skp n=1 Tax=Vibrio aestuarianus TaxID=28171 RepID=A0A9X4ER09_9VIBR|nr:MULTISPECIES: OmpH family outer membrane protein [Vibrio]MDE1221077.1 OmpH family outer membrane protein [Vibrio aestuarianus]MDE1230443.1 OmpH family outer membrane protein [Vibrio aestuarianus]MDE1233441.1 OmpH family outer membrane protein [Vibrio aestuarianus]MDE1240616.1 OmpH family outer membrane protein [Vibrio aestuarianus]MDE1244319.1 OmpH family outer membrane protein [Vibrio aestuarianus]